MYKYDNEMEIYSLSDNSKSEPARVSLPKIVNGISQLINQKRSVCCQLPTLTKFLDDMIKDEIIIIIHHKLTKCIVITNFGRIYMYGDNEYGVTYITNKCKHHNYTYSEAYKHFDFWIPIVYINIIKTVPVYENIPTHNFSYYSIFHNMLTTMKHGLINKQFMSLYIKEIVDENNKLKSEYIEHKKSINELSFNKNKFEEEKKKYITDKNTYLDLLYDKSKLKSDRYELEKEKEILRIVQLNLYTKERKLNYRDKLFDNLDISQILNDIDNNEVEGM
jgi:hypothetical protein